jgi:hypothetical protein
VATIDLQWTSVCSGEYFGPSVIESDCFEDSVGNVVITEFSMHFQVRLTGNLQEGLWAIAWSADMNSLIIDPQTTIVSQCKVAINSTFLQASYKPDLRHLTKITVRNFISRNPKRQCKWYDNWIIIVNILEKLLHTWWSVRFSRERSQLVILQRFCGFNLNLLLEYNTTTIKEPTFN